MQSHRRRIIAEALTAPPLPPEDSPLRTLNLGEHTIKLRIPVPNSITTWHIRAAHEVATADGHEPNSKAYYEALQEEFSRLQDAQPWYWDQLWPGGIALAQWLLEQPEVVRGKKVLEFGTGIGLLAVCAALAGASTVVATDIEPKALAYLRQSVEDNGCTPSAVRTVVWDWNGPIPEGDVSALAPFDVVLLPDVLYDEGAVECLSTLGPRLVGASGLLLFADGVDRPYGTEHSQRLIEAVCAQGFEACADKKVDAGASAEDGGAAPSRPVRLVSLVKRTRGNLAPSALLSYDECGGLWRFRSTAS